MRSMPLSLFGLGVLLGGTGGGPGSLVVPDLNLLIKTGEFGIERIVAGGIGMGVSEELTQTLLCLSSSLVRV